MGDQPDAGCPGSYGNRKTAPGENRSPGAAVFIYLYVYERDQRYLSTTACMAAHWSSMSATSLNWVRQRSRFWPSRWMRK